MWCRKVFALSLAFLVAGPTVTFAQAPGKKYAVIVGVSEYQHPKLPKLRFTENDASELADVLKPAGYEIILLTDTEGKKDGAKQPTKANIDKAVSETLRKSQKADTVVIALAGHGLQFASKPDSYFCPSEARPFEDEVNTLVSVTQIYEELEKSFAGVKVLLVDACRDDPNAARGASRGIDADNAPRPPRGVAALFSCSAGEVSYEHERYHHGVFFHYVLEGLRKSAKETSGEVTFDGLSKYVRNEVAKEVPRLVGGGARQSPNMKADLSGASPVLMGFYAGSRGQPVLAIQLTDLASKLAEKAGLQAACQPMVAFVIPGGGGDRMGLQTGDVICRLNGKPVLHTDDFIAVLKTLSAGDELHLTIRRAALDVNLHGKLETFLSDAELLRRIRSAAEEGSVSAQAHLWTALNSGIFGQRDTEEAIKWLQKAAENKFPSAMDQLGAALQEGRGIEKDPQRAVQLIREAADLGHPSAQVRYGMLLADGLSGVTKNEEEAVEWYRKAAEQKSSFGMYRLAGMIASGRGTKKDMAEAVMWYERASEHGNVDADNLLVELYHEGKGVEKNDTKALEYARHAAGRNSPAGMFNVGLFYSNGWGVTKDDAEAIRWLEKSAQTGFVLAILKLGERHMNGRGVPKDLTEAARWYQKAANQNSPEGQYQFGYALLYGRGVRKDETAGFALLKKSADQSFTFAWTELGRCYLFGRGVEKNYLEGVSWLRKAADKNEAAAEFHLGDCYENGFGVAKDQAEAIKFYRRGASHGNALAKKALERLNVSPE
ncbi:MAG: caspase family protein [Gemmataceae bacterium]